MLNGIHSPAVIPDSWHKHLSVVRGILLTVASFQDLRFLLIE